MSKTGLPKNTTAVVNVAGENVLNLFKRWNEDFKKKVISSRVETTTLLARAIQDAEKKPNIFVSMSGVGTIQFKSLVLFEIIVE